jgi:hypothetical protein
MRKIILPILGSAFLSGCQTLPLLSSPETLEASEVRRLFVGNTVESYNLNTGFNSFTYYHPNGQAIQERLWARRMGSWSIKEDGKICLAFGKAKPRCRHIVREGDRHYKVLVSDSGEQDRIVRYRYFARGNALAGDG